MSIFYTKNFYLRDYVRTSRSAQCIVPIIMDAFDSELDSVIDIGCGRGVWLNEFSKAGVSSIKGRDGEWVLNADPLISTSNLEVTDLSQPYQETRRYKLAMSLEVAEHIEKTNASTFVHSLTQLADSILFSAAIEGQGGQHHVNERPLSYWISHFEAEGFKVFDTIRPRIWSNNDVCWWYRQNIVIFCRKGSPMETRWQALQDSAPRIYDLAHPVGFVEKAKLASFFSPEEYIGLWLHRLKQKFSC